MLRLAVKRDRQRESALAKAPLNRSLAKATPKHLNAYIICESNRAKGFPIRHVSEGFEKLFGYSAEECLGSSCTSLVTGLDGNLNKATSTLGFQGSTEHMTMIAEQAMHSAAGGSSILIVAAKKSGELFACEWSMCTNQHPTLGWSYHAGMLRDVSNEISFFDLLKSAEDDLRYSRLCSDWAQRVRSLVSHSLRSISADLDQAAEMMWKGELRKEIQPKSGGKSLEVDACSIWSRSTASTLTSRSSRSTLQERPVGTFHFAALVQDAQGVEHADGASHADASANKRLCRRDKHSEDTGMESTGDGSDALFNAPDPGQHVNRAVLRNMKIPFAVATPTVQGFPIALRSSGFEDLQGPSIQVKKGSDARQVLKPSSPKDLPRWNAFFDSVMQGQFFPNEAEFQGEGLPPAPHNEWPLANGELAFIQTYHGKFGNPMQCLVYLKHLELDDVPYLLALHAYVPSDAEQDSSVDGLFYRVSARVDEVIYQMASEFMYFAPIRRQGKYHSM